jgi:hypothetical protein
MAIPWQLPVRLFRRETGFNLLEALYLKEIKLETDCYSSLKISGVMLGMLLSLLTDFNID